MLSNLKFLGKKESLFTIYISKHMNEKLSQRNRPIGMEIIPFSNINKNIIEVTPIIDM